MTTPWPEFKAWLERSGTLETDTVDQRRNKLTLVVLTGTCFFASIVWGVLYYATLGATSTVFLTFGFTVVMGAALVVFFATRQFAYLLYPFLLMILWNPIAMQLSLGGFATSGVVMIWSILAPFCALLFQSMRKAAWWFAAYIILLGLSLVLDGTFQQDAATVSHEISMLFFGMNIAGPALAIFATMLYFVRAFEREHARSEGLLLNILPMPIAERLKQGQEVIADAYVEVTVLFADIVNFTGLAAQRSPEELVILLNSVVTAFDRLTEQRGLEKVKTIGDAYMVAAGLPEPRPDHAEAMADLALDMQAEIARIGEEFAVPLQLRIGLNTGPVVAGVIGERKFAYDLWGDAVNTASRMDSHGVKDRIQISESTRERLGPRFDCEERGLIAIKGKTDMRTFFLNGRRPKLD